MLLESNNSYVCRVVNLQSTFPRYFCPGGDDLQEETQGAGGRGGEDKATEERRSRTRNSPSEVTESHKSMVERRSASWELSCYVNGNPGHDWRRAVHKEVSGLQNERWK